MMIERREFLQTTIGAVSGLAMPNFCQASARMMNDSLPDWQAKYEQALLASSDRDLFGFPQSRSCVRKGLHPFSPERTLILPSQARDARQIGLAQQIGRRWDEVGASKDAETILRIVQAASVLTKAYGVQERAGDWASRQLFWLFEFYNPVAQDHQQVDPCGWQGFPEPVKTTNGIVDWWLILIPQGAKVPSNDGTRLHTLITPVYTEVGKPRQPGFFWYFMARAIGLQPYASGAPRPADRSWWELSRMDAKSACLTLNQRIAANLTQMA